MKQTKEIFRKKCLEELRNLPQHNKIYRDALVTKKLWSMLKHYKQQNILFYYPMGFEVDVTKLLKKVRKKNNVYLPFMEGKSFKMVPFRLPLVKKKFGIFEAGNTLKNVKKTDIALVPIIGVDGGLQRIGFGKGMYDRFFARLQKKPYTVFISSTLCYTREHICDFYDVEADILLTPKHTIKKRAKVSKRRK